MMRALHRGYTVVELLIAMTVLAIGVSGVIAMQKVTVASNQHAKNLALATRIAQAWQDQLTADAGLWDSQGLAATTWLQQANTTTGWIRPAYSEPRDFGAAFDALGNVLRDTPTALDQGRFCTHIRLRMVYPAIAGNGLMRTEVRVFWRRDGGTDTSGTALCAVGANATTIGSALADYHFVYVASAVRQNP